MIGLFEYPAPIVALVNGHAIAGGCVLALTADWRVAPAGSKARIGLNEVALGLHYPPRVLNLVKARVPPRWMEKVVLGAELATPASHRPRLKLPLLGALDVQALEADIDRLEADLPPLTSFILPAGSPGASALHHARTVCRRAERAVVGVQESAELRG